MDNPTSLHPSPRFTCQQTKQNWSVVIHPHPLYTVSTPFSLASPLYWGHVPSYWFLHDLCFLFKQWNWWSCHQSKIISQPPTMSNSSFPSYVSYRLTRFSITEMIDEIKPLFLYSNRDDGTLDWFNLYPKWIKFITTTRRRWNVR